MRLRLMQQHANNTNQHNPYCMLCHAILRSFQWKRKRKRKTHTYCVVCNVWFGVAKNSMDFTCYNNIDLNNLILLLFSIKWGKLFTRTPLH